MNTIKTLLLNMVLPILSALPIERIVAALLNKLMDRIDRVGLEKAHQTLVYIRELTDLTNDMLKDDVVSVEKVKTVKEFLPSMRENLLAIWAKGESGKELQKDIASYDRSLSYAE